MSSTFSQDSLSHKRPIRPQLGGETNSNFNRRSTGSLPVKRSASAQNVRSLVTAELPSHIQPNYMKSTASYDQRYASPTIDKSMYSLLLLQKIKDGWPFFNPTLLRAGKEQLWNIYAIICCIHTPTNVSTTTVPRTQTNHSQTGENPNQHST